MGKLLALDLSTTSTGWALFDIPTKELIHFGLIKPNNKVPRGTQYPMVQLWKQQNISDQIVKDLVDGFPDIDRIAIEEVNRGIARLTQKTLDGLHYILMDRLGERIHKVYYRDSDGPIGWRTFLGLRLSEQDKILNDQRRKMNKKLGKGQKKFPIITKKHLACRFVNAHYPHKIHNATLLNCDLRVTDADMADAIGLGHAILHRPA